MAYPYSFIKLTFGGDLRETDEEWACGFHIGKESSNTTQADLENISNAQITAMSDDIKNFYASAAARTPSPMRLRWIKLAAIGTNGKYLGAPKEYVYSSAVLGSSSSGFVPSTATVCTLVADKFKDPGKYNRFYLPTTPPNGNNSYLLTTDQTDALASKVAGLIDTIDGALIPEVAGLRVRIVSQKTTIYRTVDHVRVGNVIDVQRRRRNRLVEAYSESDVSV